MQELCDRRWARRGGAALLVGLAVCAALPNAATAQTTSAPSRGSVAVPTADEQLWAEVERLGASIPSDGGPPAFALEQQRRERLVEKLRSYLMQFPGAAHRDEAVFRELNALFELGALQGGKFDGLAQRVREYTDRPPSPAALAEAAYWALQLRRVRGEFPTTRPINVGESTLPAGFAEAVQEYIERYPSSRHVTRMSEVLFDEAQRRADRERMRRIVARLAASFPQHATTELLTAALRRDDAVGKPFTVQFGSGATAIDTSAWRGKFVVIVVWTALDDACRRRVVEIEQARRNRDDVQVLGVNIDRNREELRQAAGELDIDWPQIYDGLGWAGDFLRQWGVRSAPFVFVIDREGRLAGAGDGADWGAWLKAE